MKTLPPDEKSQIVTIILVLAFVTLLVSACIYEGVQTIFTEIIEAKPLEKNT